MSGGVDSSTAAAMLVHSGENLVGFFEDWFIRHVLSRDREYAAYVKAEMPATFGKRSA